MKNLVRKILFPILCSVVLCLSGCNKVKDIKVTSFVVENVVLNGMRGMTAYVAVGVDNPAFMVNLSEIEGALELSGKVLGRVAVDPFTLHARSAEVYHLKAIISIEPGVTLSELAVLLDKQTLYQCMVDVSVRATLKGGVSKLLKFNDIPVKNLI